MTDEAIDEAIDEAAGGEPTNIRKAPAPVVVRLPRGRKALAKRPPGRPPKHGAYSGLEMMALTKGKDAEIRAILYEAKVVYGGQDALIIRTLASTLAKIETIDRWLTVHGLFDETGQPQAVLKIWLAAVNSAARICDQLGLTPQSRARLGITLVQAKRSMAAAMHDAKKSGNEVDKDA